jgi:hypothetical protein
MTMKTWSHSQTGIMRKCERRWFMSYGLGAKTRSKDQLLKEIAFLKKLKPSFMWRGDLVHSVIADILKMTQKGNKVAIETAHQILAKRAIDQWDDSKRRSLNSDPKSSLEPEGPILMEHYYKSLDTGVDLNEIKESAHQQLSSLHSWIERNGLFKQIKDARRTWIDPPAYFPNSPGFMVDDVRFITKVDLALLQDESFDIFDWKTGIEPKGEFHLTYEHRQVCFYALWPHLEMSQPIENIKIGVVYVGGLGPQMHKITLLPHNVDDLLADAELLVTASKEFLDPQNGFSLEDFDWATSAKTCLWCPFQQICQRELS